MHLIKKNCIFKNRAGSLGRNSSPRKNLTVKETLQILHFFCLKEVIKYSLLTS